MDHGPRNNSVSRVGALFSRLPAHLRTRGVTFGVLALGLVVVAGVGVAAAAPHREVRSALSTETAAPIITVAAHPQTSVSPAPTDEATPTATPSAVAAPVTAPQTGSVPGAHPSSRSSAPGSGVGVAPSPAPIATSPALDYPYVPVHISTPPTGSIDLASTMCVDNVVSGHVQVSARPTDGGVVNRVNAVANGMLVVMTSDGPASWSGTFEYPNTTGMTTIGVGVFDSAGGALNLGTIIVTPASQSVRCG